MAQLLRALMEIKMRLRVAYSIYDQKIESDDTLACRRSHFFKVFAYAISFLI